MQRHAVTNISFSLTGEELDKLLLFLKSDEKYHIANNAPVTMKCCKATYAVK